MPPTHELLWAEGKGHAWFCETHFKAWISEHTGDIDSIKEVKDGEAAKKFSDNSNPNISKKFGEATFVLQHQWFKEKLNEHWDLRMDLGDDIVHMVLEYNPLKESTIECCMQENTDKSWFSRGRKIERISPGSPGNITESSPSWLQMLDEGTIKVSEKTDNSMKIVFNGKKLKESWTLSKKEDRPGWFVLKSEKGC